MNNLFEVTKSLFARTCVVNWAYLVNNRGFAISTTFCLCLNSA
jgi:hypothetical protein